MSGRRFRGDDSGAVAVMFVLLLVPLLAVVALVVDVGAAYVEKRELQNGTDAAALAIAYDCGKGTCGNVTSTAQKWVIANGVAATVIATVDDRNYVKVSATGTVDYRFAPAIGFDSSVVGSVSWARWGAPNGGRAVLPLAFSWCSFKAQTGGGLPSGTTASTINFSKTDGTTDCTSPSGNAVPGGFAWIQATAGACSATTSTSTLQIFSDPGNSVPSSCSTSYIAAQQNKSVLLPVFDRFGGTGSGAWYHIYAYAAFHLTGYNFGGQYKWNTTCSGNNHCIHGYFTRMVDVSESFTYSADIPNLGASVIALAPPPPAYQK